MTRLKKGYSAGFAALVYAGSEALDTKTMHACLDPVTGIGADGLVWVSPDGQVKTFDTDGAVIPSTAASIRLAAAHRTEEGETSPLNVVVAGGVESVSVEVGEYVLNQGVWSLPGGSKAAETGYDSTVSVSGMEDPRPGLRVSVGGRTVTVVVLESAGELSGLNLLEPPQVQPRTDLVAFVSVMGERNVDLTDETGAVVGTQAIGAVQVRGCDIEHGEVFSSDALAGAAAAAVHTWFGPTSAQEWITVFPMGTTRAQLTPGKILLTAAEATFVAEIEWRD